jgi:hypothetical protein
MLVLLINMEDELKEGEGDLQILVRDAMKPCIEVEETNNKLEVAEEEKLEVAEEEEGTANIASIKNIENLAHMKEVNHLIERNKVPNRTKENINLQVMMMNITQNTLEMPAQKVDTMKIQEPHLGVEWHSEEVNTVIIIANDQEVVMMKDMQMIDIQ